MAKKKAKSGISPTEKGHLMEIGREVRKKNINEDGEVTHIPWFHKFKKEYNDSLLKIAEDTRNNL